MESWEDIITKALPTITAGSYKKLIKCLADIGVENDNDLQFVTLEDIKDVIPLIAARKLLSFLKTRDADGTPDQNDKGQTNTGLDQDTDMEAMDIYQEPSPSEDTEDGVQSEWEVLSPTPPPANPAIPPMASPSHTGHQRHSTKHQNNAKPSSQESKPTANTKPSRQHFKDEFNTQPSTQQTKQEVASKPSTPDLEEKVQEIDCGISMSDISNLLSRLSLDVTQTIKTSEVLQLSSYSLHVQESNTEKELAIVFLQKLLTANYNARYTSIKGETSLSGSSFRECQASYNNGFSALFQNNKGAGLSNSPQIHPMNLQKGGGGEEAMLGGSQPLQEKGEKSDVSDVFAAIFKSTSVAKPSKPAQIHPMDLQMAVFHCADHFLKQIIVTKLSQCQYALPLLVSNPFTNEIEFPLWTFQQIKKSWKKTDSTGHIVSQSQSVCKAETPMVAFFRLGSVSSSKSQLMNSLINEKHNTFFHRNCPGSSRTRLLMEGVVEIAWYCPSGKPTDKFTDCVAFCNLHGHAGACPAQRRIVTELATINVVFISEQKQNSANMTIVQELFKSPKPLICILTENEDPIAEIGKDKYKLGLKNRNQSDVSEELNRAIKQNLSERTVYFNMENMSRYQEVRIDTESNECKRGRDAAIHIMHLLGTQEPLKMKEAFLPCQGQLWHEWSQISKELHRLRGDKPEKEKSAKQSSMKDLRLRQRAQGQTGVMKLFTDYLKSLSVAEGKYFLKWIGSLLDDFASDKLYDLLHEYDVKWKQVLDLKKTHGKTEQMDKEQNELEKISNRLSTATFGLEHFLREMGQVYEAWESTQKDVRGEDNMIMPELPKMAAELMISGHPLELMDGDAAHVPLVWVSAVLDELIKILGDKRVFVLSVLGIQSSGKSTMLNAMFGLQFAVSAGRCTRGAFMQLVKVAEEMKAKLKFDYILVVDTEGLRALELAGKITIHHDNELATFVVGLGNMTLINIFGENPSEMQDILQIVVQAFLRMKKVRLNPSCMFVHQNVTDVTAGEKNMEGRRRLQEKLDEMTKLAAEQEVCDAECFSDVISFDIQKDVKYFAQLWEGSPPMAPPNPSYSESIQELRNTVVSHASKSNGLTLTELKERVKDLWNALLSEDFVFSFKNTLEIAAYRTLEEEYGKWTWCLRSEMLKIEEQLHTKINNFKLHEVSKSLLAESSRETLQNIQRDMGLYFDHEKSKDILVQWKVKFEIKIKELHEELVQKVTTKLADVILQRNARKKLDEKKDQHDKKLFDKSKELALKLRQKGISKAELRKAFDSMWEDWAAEVKSHSTPVGDVNIRQDMLNILYEIFEYSLVQECLDRGKFKTINQIGDYTHYVTVSRGFVGKVKDAVLGDKGLKPEDNNSIRELINDVTKKAGSLVKTKPDKGYNPSYIQEIAHLVTKCVKEYKPITKFEFKREFKVDLSLYVCEPAVLRFVELHKMFREANDPHIYLEKKKPEYYKIFQIYCRGANCAAVLGDLICNELREPILRKAYNKSATDIAGEMRTSIPAFNGNRSNMEKHILRALAEGEDFDKFMTYIQNPREHFENFIMGEVDEYMRKSSPAGDPIILTMIRQHIKDLQKAVVRAAVGATEQVKADGGDTASWLEYFSDGLTDLLENRCTDLSQENVNDFDLLVDIIKRELCQLTEDLTGQLSSLEDLNMEMFRESPDKILIEHFCQCCWHQCPFCKAICTNTIEGHPGDHMVPFHRAVGITGWTYRNTDTLCSDFCTTLVVSDKSFSSSSEEYTPFKDYRSAGGDYATWSITPDNSELPYWKWFVWQFQSELEEHYSRKLEPEVEEWRKHSKEDAIESLDKYI